MPAKERTNEVSIIDIADGYKVRVQKISMYHYEWALFHEKDPNSYMASDNSDNVRSCVSDAEDMLRQMHADGRLKVGSAETETEPPPAEELPN